MPRRLASRLAPPQVLEVVPEFDRVDRRRKVGVMRPPHHQLALRRLLLPGVLGHPLASAVLGHHGGQERQRRGGGEREQDLERKEEGGSGSKIGEAQRVSEQRACGFSLFYGEGAGRHFTIYCDVTHDGSNRPTHDPHITHDPHVVHSTRVMGKRIG